MFPFKFPNANCATIAVTGTATSLVKLINTAGSATLNLPADVIAVDLYIENGDVRLLYDGNTPTASVGILLKQGTVYRYRGVPPSLFQLISTSGSNVTVDVIVGTASGEDLQNSSAGFVSSVNLGTALTGVSAGVENDNVLTGPYRRPDAFQDISYDSTNVGANSAVSIKSATAAKKHNITSLTISTSVATTVTIQDASSNVLEKIIFPAAGVFVGSYADCPLQGATNSALQVISSAGSGNLTVKGRGYTI